LLANPLSISLYLISEKKMAMKTDEITTVSNTVTGICALLAANGIYPQYLGFVAALSHFVSGYFTNKPTA